MDKTKKSRNNSALILIFLAMAVYLSSYVGRKSYDSNINNVIKFFGVTKSEAGLVGTFFFIAYAAGQVIHGLFCKYYPKRWSIFLACAVSATMTLLMGIMPPSAFGWLKFFWLINGFCLASLWSSFILIFATSFAKVRRKQALVIMALPVSVGTFLCYGLSSLFTFLDNFKLMFYVGAGALYLFGLLWFIFFEKLTMGALAERRELDGLGDPIPQNDLNKENKKPRGKAKLFSTVLIFMFFFAIVDNFVKDGVTTWAPTIFKEKYGLEDWLSILVSLGIPLCAVFGSFAVLAMSKKIKSPVMINCVLFCVATAVLGLLIGLFELNSWIIPLLCFMFLSSVMSAINNDITNIFPMTCVDSENSGLVAGLIDGFCYVGSAISSYGLGAISEGSGSWNAVMWILFGACAVAFVLSAGYSIFEFLKKRKINKNAI